MVSGRFDNRTWYAQDDRAVWAYDSHIHRLMPLEFVGDPMEAVAVFAETMASEDDIPAPDPRMRGWVRNLKLSLSGQCNLDCSYCFRSGAISELTDDSIPFRAMDAMADDFGSRAKDYSVTFNLTSEPLLQWPLLERLLQHGDAVTRRTGKPIYWYILTNGTVDSSGIEAFLPELIRRTGTLAVSIDGPREIHDAHRRYADGRGTHDRLEDFIRKYRGHAEHLEAETVLTADHPRPWSIIGYLLELGFTKISSRIVRSEGSRSEVFREGYEELFAELQRRIRKDDFSLFTVLRHDHSLRPMWKILSGLKAVYRCYWGLTHLVVDGRGRYTTCDGMIGRTEGEVGSVDDGLDWDAFHRDMSVLNRDPCRKCWARYLCGGTCYLHGADTTGDPLSVDPDECRHNEFIIGKNLELAAEAMKKPGRLSRLKEAVIRF